MNESDKELILAKTVRRKIRTLKPYEKNFIKKGEFRYHVPQLETIESGNPTVCYTSSHHHGSSTSQFFVPAVPHNGLIDSHETVLSTIIINEVDTEHSDTTTTTVLEEPEVGVASNSVFDSNENETHAEFLDDPEVYFQQLKIDQGISIFANAGRVLVLREYCAKRKNLNPAKYVLIERRSLCFCNAEYRWAYWCSCSVDRAREIAAFEHHINISYEEFCNNYPNCIHLQVARMIFQQYDTSNDIEALEQIIETGCLEDGDVKLYGLHNGSIVAILDNCTNEKLTADKSNVFTVPNKCLNTSQENITSVNLKVFDPAISKIKYPNPPPPTRNYEGGLGIQWFTLICKRISDDGVGKTAVRVFQNKIYDVLSENMEVDGVDMRFKAVNNTNSPDINTIYVGDEFFMYINYKGSQSYSLVPKKCYAFKGTISSADENQVELWNWSKLQNHCTQAKELLESFSRVSPTVIYAKMYGFRFADSNFITIQCEVGIYPDQQMPLCSDDGTASTAAPSGRRRRQIEEFKIKTKSAFAKLYVLDNKDIFLMENKSVVKAGNTSLWIIMCVCVFLSREYI